MASIYKLLGDYIEPVELKNSDGALDEADLRGISVNKEFIDTHANLVGVTFEGYKVVPAQSFAYIPDTSRRGDRIAIAFNDSGNSLIVSSICTVFKVVKTDQLDSEYLNLWFNRSEFDRYARFKSHGSAREVFDWDQLCAVELPIPEIDIQQKIVSIKNCIDLRAKALAEQNDYLLELIEAVFRSWFIGENALYPTSRLPMSEIALISAGGDKPAVCQQTPSAECSVPIYSNGTDNEGLYGYTDAAKIIEPSVTVSARGTIGFTCLRYQPYYPIVRLISATPKEKVTAEYLYLWLRGTVVTGVGTTQQQLTVPMFKNYEVNVPDAGSLDAFMKIATPLFALIDANKSEMAELAELRDALLPKLMSGEIDISRVEL